MQHEDVFRLILILGFAVVFPIGFYHRLKAHLASNEKLNRRAEGVFVLTTLRPIALLGILGLFAYIINPAWMGWASVGLPISIRWIGVGLGMVAMVLLIVVLRNLGTNLTDTVVTRSHHTLVISGPYRWVRHPFYVATALAVAANSLVTANWFLALIGIVTVVLIVVRTRTEEQKLIERFGDEYKNYMERTGRFIPRMRG
ncbi:MAG: isoprenylcysteine carboxylmethyltransferase family protein [Phycisphaerales bacterium]|nr:isoprenylcysteine carboxylmethyltransferase family protein [Phycisphaerales bacterium]